jgi:FAD/FMN-containing dehydrogenase
LIESTSARRYESWGRYPKPRHRALKTVRWQEEMPDLSTLKQSILPVGYGRSYGDSCLNDNGILIDTTELHNFIAFDEQNGLLRCEAGVMLSEILEVMMPRGWFLPVTPGTRFVSVAGAIANDVHGKNHHKAGTFGCHVTQLELLRSNGERLICSPTENANLFRATIGGLGLTGIILWAEFRMRPIPGPFIAMEQIKFGCIEEFFELSADSDARFDYAASWIDCLSDGKNLGRGWLQRGNYDPLQPPRGKQIKPKSLFKLPIDVPSFALNPLTLKIANTVLYHMQLPKKVGKVVPYDKFFYPLDAIEDWNRGYGKAGFLQYQLVIPYNDNYRAMHEILKQIRMSGEASFLTVLKTFGNIKSPGMLSFPRPGVTLSIDFPYRGDKTLRLLDRLDLIVQANCGAVYPAKDARMSAESFQAYFPHWNEFAKYVDPHFSSNFWRRVSQTNGTSPK